MTHFIKFNFRHCALIVLCVLALASCRNPGTGNNDDDAGPDYVQEISMTINDTTMWVGDEMSATIIDGAITIISRGDNFSVLTLYIGQDSEGVYTLNQLSTHAAAYIPVPGPNIFFSKAGSGAGGTVQISEINTVDSLLSGTFDLNLINPDSMTSTVITDGVFKDIKYIFAPPSQNGDMAANIDSIPWVAASINGNVDPFSNKLIIKGTDATGFQQVTFHIPEESDIGVYSVGNPSFSTYGATYRPPGFSSPTLVSMDGMLTINVHDHFNDIISGTFYFHAVDNGVTDQTGTITNGSFYLEY